MRGKSRGLARLVGLVLALAAPAAAPSALGAQVEPLPDTVARPEPGSELRVWLVTIGPGEEVWERFGHNALRVLDTGTGRDVAYNWGIFDFNQVDFIPRFLRGEMLYMMASFPTAPMVDAYARSGREVVHQELDLTPAEKLELYDLAETNALPENRDYRYDYFIDNCSTRVRDLLDRVLGGVLGERFRGVPGTSYRWHTRRLTRVDPLLYTGMDLLLGARGDDPITLWEESFLPMSLRDGIRDVARPGADGVRRPLVLAEQVVLEARGIEEPTAPPRWLPIYLILGLALGALFAWLGDRSGPGVRGGLHVPVASRWAAAALAVVGGVWGLVAGVVGTILVAVLFTDHWSMAWNMNLFFFNPLHLPLAALVPLAAFGRTRARAATLARWALWLAAVGAVVSLLPIQTNGIFAAWALPAQLGLWWGLRGMVSEPGGGGPR